MIMNIYQKLNEARRRFHSTAIKKSGHNKFAGYQYFELGDFLVHALAIFADVGLCAMVRFEKDVASMDIVDVDKPESRIVFTSPMGSAALKGCHEVQNIGAVETYQRRYLWVAALEIVEHDALDATTGAERNSQGRARSESGSPTAIALGELDEDSARFVRQVAQRVMTAPTVSEQIDIIEMADLDADRKSAMWGLLDSKTRSAIKKAKETA